MAYPMKVRRNLRATCVQMRGKNYDRRVATVLSELSLGAVVGGEVEMIPHEVVLAELAERRTARHAAPQQA